MRRQTLLILLLSASASAKPPMVTPLIGTFTNEEQVYFDKEAGRPAMPWFSMKITPREGGLMIDEIDAYGKPTSDGHPLKTSRDGKMTILDYGACQRLYTFKNGGLVGAGTRGKCSAPASITAANDHGLTLTFPDGRKMDLRRSRPVTCWVAVRKDKNKEDGSEDWHFERGVKLHDQGGRASVGGGNSGAQPVVIRIRNVTWDVGSTNNPVVTLYVHKPDKPDRAESYSWAAPDSARIGINLRWMQAGCNYDEKGPPSKLNTQNFRG